LRRLFHSQSVRGWLRIRFRRTLSESALHRRAASALLFRSRFTRHSAGFANSPQSAMEVTVHFYSYFKDLTGCAELRQAVPDEQTLGEFLDDLSRQFPKLGAMRKSILAAVGLDYQTRDYRLKAGDEVSLFPPV